MANTRQLSFSGGEISPSLRARVDMVKYATGLKTCRNFMIQRHGGAANRPGTGFNCEVKTSSKKVKLIPFIFNSDQTYALEFGDQYMRVIRNGAQVTEAAQNITGATQANPCVITIAGHGYSNGEEVYIASVAGMTELNGRNFKVANVAANTFELQYMNGTNVNSAAFGAYTSGGTAARVYTIATPYLEADLPTLQYVQSADIVQLVHPNYAPRELTRTAHTSWTLTAITFGPTIATPTGLVSSAPGVAFGYVVTAVDAETGEESLPSASAASVNRVSTLTWNTVAAAGYYNVYLGWNGQLSWIGVAGQSATPSFTDVTYTPDTSDNPPVARTPFTGAGNYPSTVAFFQQRIAYANTNNNPEGVWTSKTGLFKNFMKSTPIQDDDPVTFSIVGQQVNKVQHLFEAGKPMVFTASSEYSLEGDAAGILIPGEVNPRAHTFNGSGSLAPLMVGGNVLYVQARGSVIRDLGYDYQSDGYKGNELSIFASHLFDDYTIADWAYQQVPHSIVWCARNDGKLLGLTYIREHQVFGWHQHDFENGTVENVCVIPEGTQDVLYMVIKRTINGAVVRYIERMKTRSISDIVDAVFMDSSLTYDGRNTNGSHTMTLSGGTTWAYDEDLTLTSSAAYFSSTDVGNAIVLTWTDGTELRCEITGYTGATVVTVRANKTVPAAMRSVAISDWSKAVEEVSGLWHLEGQTVSVLADGFVSSNPNNPSYTVRTVTSGKVTLDDPHSVIHVGLPIVSDLETLNIDFAGISSTADKMKNISGLTMFVESSRGIWAGPDADHLTEVKTRSDEGYDKPVALSTGIEEVNITPEWNSNGQVFIRQTDPLPLAILAVVPAGFIPAA